MTASAYLAYPGGRTLAAWWRQLAGHHPQSFWAGYLTFHHIDAPVLVLRPQQLPPFELFVLKAAVAQPTPASAADLALWLHVDAALVQRALQHLTTEGLVFFDANGTAAVTA